MTLGSVAAFASCARGESAAGVASAAASTAVPAAVKAAPPVPLTRHASAYVARASTPVPRAAAKTVATIDPQIFSVSVTPGVVHAGQSVSFSARTSTDVATVTGTVTAYTLHFTREAPGRFALSFAIPTSVPGFFHGTYAMNVTARASGGSSATRSVSVTFQ